MYIQIAAIELFIILTPFLPTWTVDLPKSPLQTDAPQLEHVNKGRPKPPRLQKGGGATKKHHKPAHLVNAKDEVDLGKFLFNKTKQSVNPLWLWYSIF